MMQSRAQFGMYGAALPNIIVILTYIGYFVSSAVLGGLAVASLFHVTTTANSAVSANAPSYLSGLLSVSWLFLIIIILGVGSGNFGNLYGPFLTLFAVISPSGSLASKTTGRVARMITTTVLAIIGTFVAIEASHNFMTDLTNFLVFTLYLLVPWTAINLTDYYVIRRGHYDIPELFRTDGKYGRVNWFAVAVYVLAVGIQFPFMNDPAVYVGPIANSLGGADIAWIVRFVFAAGLYWVGARYWLSAPTRESSVLVPGK
jgi:nucleobase:cation symporter-1, NCS1 family